MRMKRFRGEGWALLGMIWALAWPTMLEQLMSTAVQYVDAAMVGRLGAQATAAVIFLARTGHSKPEIKQYVEQTFGYDLNRTCDEIRPTYHHVETCQETVPEAIIAFLESVSFEDALRNAVSLGGDSDTLACITGGIAEAFYGMPQELRDETLKRLPEDIREGYELFRWNIGQR